MNFNNKNILITGASRGIGRATAIAFAQKGANVAINYHTNDKAAQETLELLGSGNHSSFKADISNESEVEQLLTHFIDKYGKIDVLVNNAGILIPHEIDKVDFDTWKNAWRKIIDTNLVAIANLSYFAAQHMIKQGGGRIVNVSSRGAFRGEPTQPAYGASKAALNSLSQSLAKQLAKHHIYIGVVAPGFTETDMGNDSITPEEKNLLLNESPFKRMALPEEVAHSLLFLASDGAEYNSGAIIDVNGASYLR